MSSIALFPAIDKSTVTDSEKAQMASDRLRWVESMYSGSLETLRDAWEGTDYLIEERSMHSSLPLEEFHRVSVTLGLHLLRTEIEKIPWLRMLKDCLRLRTEFWDPVMFVGPTSGAEIEAIHVAKGSPILVTDSGKEDQPWINLCEERLLHSGIPHESLPLTDLVSNPFKARYIVISPWVPNQEETIRASYNALGKYGFILTPSTNPTPGSVATGLGMIRQDVYQNEVWSFFKHPGLPEKL